MVKLRLGNSFASLLYLLRAFLYAQYQRNHLQRTFALFAAVALLQTYCCALLTICPSHAQAVGGTKFGENLGNIGYYAATDGAYVDIIRKASDWSPGNYPSPPLTANGYPTTTPAGAPSWSGITSFFTLLGYPTGTQILNFYGEGIFNLGFNGFYINNAGYPNSGIVPNTLHTTVNSDGVTVTTCQVSVTIPPPVLGGYALAQSIPLTWLTLTNINPNGLANGYPNNFHLISPGCPAWIPGGNNPTFTPNFLASLQPFSCLRFMGWMNANGNTNPYDWTDRSQPGYYGSGNGIGGAPYEDMIALCNQLKCDMWISVPTQATTAWKTNFATLVKNSLNPDLHIRIEHGNELWNWAQAFWPGTMSINKPKPTVSELVGKDMAWRWVSC